MLKLDPTHIMLWRSTTSVQFGADKPVVILTDVGTNEERIIAVLAAGVSEVSLRAIATNLFVSNDRLQALLDELSPALVAQPIDRSWRICIDGTGGITRWLRDFLQASGHEIVTTSPHVALVIGQHVLGPDHAGSWLRQDIAHLPIIFGDSLVRIGPLITPGTGPCMHCVNLRRAQEDRLWPVFATQLLGRASPLGSTQLSVEVAAMITRWIDNSAGPHSPSGWSSRLDPTQGLHRGEAVVLDAATGRTSRVTYSPQAACACRALPQNVTPIVSRRDESPVRPTTKRVGAAPE